MDFNVGKSVKQLDNELNSKLNAMLTQWNLTRSQFFILTFLMINANQEISQKDIELAFHLKNPTVSGIVKLLEKNGFIKRQVNPADKRYNLLFLTGKSRALKPLIFKFMRNSDRQILKGFSEKEKKQLENFLERMIKNISGTRDL
ncbi:MAG: MarR family transcriptional regulator [Bacillota bacterium]|nr:MarR family transcriptional regulator [Bacillota bacterium]